MLDGLVAADSDMLVGEAPLVVVRMVDGQRVADALGGLAARLVELEGHLPAGGVEHGAAIAGTAQVLTAPVGVVRRMRRPASSWTWVSSRPLHSSGRTPSAWSRTYNSYASGPVARSRWPEVS
ncbi:hypothetical protein [Streptomyces sp. NPDC059874]|uniref:hypothetical protein n=1 Tax=Streptomyces sp. NPDC059874 TaxID=3346983 RepID=UPI0036490FC1